MSDDWTITTTKKPKTNQATFIEGLPGIGNVGKVVVDHLIEQTNAKKIARFFSRSLPNTVFVGEDNLISLPSIEVYQAKIAGKDYLLMTGDVQPADEVASYKFCEAAINHAKEWGASSVITLGGIGLHEDPDKPDVYCTGNDKEYIKRFTDHGARKDVYGVVGPIIGVSGLLLGIAQREGLPAVTLLAETLGHPMYLGLKGAKEIITIMNESLGISISVEELEKEIAEEDDEEDPKRHRHDNINKLKRIKDTNYIG